MKHVVIAPFDGDTNAVLAGLKEFPTEKVILLARTENFMDIGGTRKDFARFDIPLEVVEIENENNFEEIFEKIAHIKAKEKGKDILMNLSSTSGMLSCVSLSAAFVNGLKTFGIVDEKLVLFPILKFSYYDMLSDKKLQILKMLGARIGVESLEALSRSVHLGPSLINYHVYGNEKNPGLKGMGLVEIERKKGRVALELTALGRLLLKDRQFQQSTASETLSFAPRQPSKMVLKAIARN